MLVMLMCVSGGAWAETVTETFENQTAGTTYNGQITYKASESNAGISWFVEHGTVSTTGKITGSNSLHMRAYYAKSSAAGTWNGALPYAETKTPIKGLQSFTFNAAVSNTGIKMDVYYSTDGSSWTQIGTTKTFSDTSAADAGTFNIPSSNAGTNYYIKIAASSSSTHSAKPTNAGNYTFRIDDVAFTYAAATTAYTVTFDGNGHGTPASASLTEANAGAGITLPGCSADAGYSFKGWADAADATSANVGAAGASYNPTDDVTLYAYYVPTYTLTITQPAAGGTLTVSDANGALATGATVEVGTNLTCEVTDIPEGKRFSRFYVNYDGDGSIYKSTNPATFDNIPTSGITAAEVTVSYMDLAQYTINYMVNGVNTNAQENVWEGTTLEFPTPEAINGKSFIGWIEETIDGTTNTAPSFVNIEGLTATANKTYYAVFANVTPGDATTTTDVLTRETTGVDDGATTYSAWSNKTATSDAVYAGSSAGGNNSIQLRNNSNPGSGKTATYDGIITTTSGGKAKKVVVVWDSNTTDGRTLNVYGKNTAYTSVQSVFDTGTQGTELGTIVKGTSTTLNITGDYKFIAFASKSGAMYITSISIDWENGTPDSYADYCTTVALPVVYTYEVLAFSAQDGDGAYWATFSSEKDAFIDADEVIAYAVTAAGSSLSLNGDAFTDETIDIPSDGEFHGLWIPANTGALLYSTSDEISYYIVDNANVAAITASNDLYPASKDKSELSGYKFYMLAYGDAELTPSTLGFYWGAAEGGTFDSRVGSAYLAVKETLARGFSFSEDTEALETIEVNAATTIYTLNGVKVNELQKGLNIVNGKKVMVK